MTPRFGRRPKESKPKEKVSPSNRWRRRRERARRGLAILPSLLTLGNAICGIAAIVKIAKIQHFGTPPAGFDVATNLHDAALLILLGMVFDVLDGRVARLTRTTSDFGGQLDSLSDAVTFGVAPAVTTIMANSEARFPGNPFWTKVAWVFGIAYACGAISRLARFNVESDDHDEKAHLEFKGLPSPGAAGVIASLVLLQSYLLGPRAKAIPLDPTLATNVGDAITYFLPFAALACGYLMISKFKYVHVANRFLRGRKPFYYLRIILVVSVLFALLPEVMTCVSFVVFALTGPLLALRSRTDAVVVTGGNPEPSGGVGAVATAPSHAPGTPGDPAHPIAGSGSPAGSGSAAGSGTSPHGPGTAAGAHANGSHPGPSPNGSSQGSTVPSSEANG